MLEALTLLLALSSFSKRFGNSGTLLRNPFDEGCHH
jgi:hypothetical protein